MEKMLRILILEDNEYDAELMLHELKRSNFLFKHKLVNSRDSFVIALDEFNPDLIICDFKIPDFDGLSALHISREKYPDLPFIVVSGTVGEEMAVELLKSGAAEFLLKDNIDKLVSKIYRALREYNERFERISAEKALTKKTHELSERLKELTCLYDISALINKVDVSLEEVLQNTVNILAKAFQHPEHVSIRLSYHEQVYLTDEFRESQWKMEEPIVLDKREIGKLEVFYNKEFPKEDIGPFYKEEKILLNAVANLLDNYLQRCDYRFKLIDQQEKLIEAQTMAKMGSFDVNFMDNSLQWSDGVYYIYEISKDIEPDYDLFAKYIHPEDRYFVNKESLDRDILEKGHIALRHRILLDNNRVKWIFAELKLKYDKGNNPIGIIGAIQDITDQVIQENEIKESEERFRSMADNAPAMIWVSDEDNKDIFFNKGWLNYTGHTLEDDLSGGWLDLIHPEDKEGLFEKSLDAFRTKEPLKIEFRMRRHDGEYRWISDRAIPRFYADGNYAGFIGICIDITDQRTAHQRVAEKEEFVSSILNSLSAHITVLDEKGVIIAANKEWNLFADQNGSTSLKSVSEGADYLATCQKAIENGEEGTKEIKEGIEAVLAGKKKFYSTEYPCHSPDKQRWYLMRVTPLSSGNGVVIAHEDITQRLLAEQATRESEKKFRHLFMSNPLPMWLYDPHTLMIEEVNASTINKYGYTRSEFLELSILDIRPKEDKDELMRYIKEKKKNKKTWRHELKSGELIHVNVESEKINYGEKELILAMVNDVTEVVRSEQQLIESREFYKSILENSVEGISILDKEGRIKYQSPSNKKVTGYDVTENIGKDAFTLIHPEFKDFAAQKLREVFNKENELITTSLKLLHKEGHDIYVELTAINLLNNPGVEGIVINYRDITEKKAAEDQKQLLLDILEATSDFVSMATTKGVPFYINKAGLQALKFEQQSSYPGIENYHPQWAFEKVRDEAMPAAVNNGTWLGETALINAEGKEIPVSQLIISHKNEKGEIEHFSSVMRDISEQKKTLQALQQSERRFAQVFNSAPIPITITRISDGRIIDVNNSFTAFYGCIKEMILGKTSMDLNIYVNPEDRQLLFSALKEEQKPFLFELEINTFSGSTRLVLISVENIIIEEEECFLSMIIDITERKRSEEQIKISEKSYRDIFDNSLDMFFIEDLNGTFLDVNKAVINAYQFDKEELVGKNAEMLSAPGMNDMEAVKAKILLTVKGNPQEFIFWSQKKNGDIFPTEVMFRRGSYFGTDVIIATGRDISERIYAEAEIRKNEALFRKLFENAPIGIVKLDAMGNIQKLNGAFEQIFQFSQEELAGKNIDDELMTWEYQEEARKISADTIAGKRSFLESYRKRKDGTEVPVLIYSVPVEVEDEVIGFFGIYVDIEDRKKAEEELKVMTSELVRYNKDLEHFAYVTSHNLRAPVANLNGLMNLYDKELDENTENLVLIKKMEQSISNLDIVLKDLVEMISVKRNVTDNLQEIDLQQITETVLQDLENEINEKDVTISLNFSDAPNIIYSHTYLQSILLNLISNAIKYHSPERKPEIRIYTSRNSEFTTLTVEDNGLGIDLEKNKDRMFRMYQRLHPEHSVEGKGLGLYIIKSQVESLGGTIEVQSEPGKGTRFLIYLKNTLKQKDEENIANR